MCIRDSNKNFSMTCSKDSAAEKYAKENGITYDTYQVKIDELAVSGIKDKSTQVSLLRKI